MLIIPSIDLQQGQCVRLQRGQFDKVSSYQVSAERLAANYKAVGAKRLHIVELDGCKSGYPQQLSMLPELLNYGMDIQWGGGLRDMESIRKAIDTGAAYIVIGSLCITDPVMMAIILNKVSPEKIVLALDVSIKEKIPYVVTHAWQQETKISLWDVLEKYKPSGIQSILCTDINQDGMLQGPNFDLYTEAIKRFPSFSWQASGGIRDINDLTALASIGLHSAIIGRALYENSLDLADCLKRFASC